MYSLHDIEVTGLELAEVLECEIESRAGEHSRLVLLARMADEEIVFGLPDCQDVEVSLHEGKENRILFSGIVTDIQMSENGQVKTARIEGKSRSWLMDREKHSRSFQDSKMTFQGMVREILRDYEETDLHYAAKEKELGNLVIQYEETDWEFLQRALSQAGIM
ncbi:MAG: phage late control D family protein, partial [Acetatifactor sp.]|nr:phage late control D family protein [Acetatifactor sp.]